MTRIRLNLFVIAAAWIVLPTIPVQAQPEQPTYVTIKGTLEQITSEGYLKVTSDANEPYLIGIDRVTTKVVVVGTAERDFVTQGLLVRFTGEFDKRGNSKGEISELSIVEPSEQNYPGVQKDGNPLVILDDDKKKKSKDEGGTYLVVGQVKSLRGAKLQVSANGQQVKATLAKDATINVDVTNYHLAIKGDKIEAYGQLVQKVSGKGKQLTTGQVFASELTVTLANPLSKKKKKPTRDVKTAKGKAAKRGENAKGNAAADEESDKGKEAGDKSGAEKTDADKTDDAAAGAEKTGTENDKGTEDKETDGKGADEKSADEKSAEEQGDAKKELSPLEKLNGKK